MKRDYMTRNAKIPKVVSGCGAEKTFGMGHKESYSMTYSTMSDVIGYLPSSFCPIMNPSPITAY